MDVGLSEISKLHCKPTQAENEDNAHYPIRCVKCVIKELEKQICDAIRWADRAPYSCCWQILFKLCKQLQPFFSQGSIIECVAYIESVFQLLRPFAAQHKSALLPYSGSEHAAVQEYGHWVTAVKQFFKQCHDRLENKRITREELLLISACPTFNEVMKSAACVEYQISYQNVKFLLKETNKLEGEIRDELFYTNKQLERRYVGNSCVNMYLMVVIN